MLYKAPKEYRKKSNKSAAKYRDSHGVEIKQYRDNHKEKAKKYNKYKNRVLRLSVYKLIADKHEHSICCWRCGETREWLLTVGHVDGNGKKDRESNGCTGNVSLFRKIINGNRDVNDLEIECIGCNLCKQWYGFYPDELTKDKFEKLFEYNSTYI